MFMMPKFNKNTDSYARSYVNGKIRYTGDMDATTDLEKRYKAPITKLNKLIDDIHARIRKIDTEKASFADNYVKKPELQIKMLEIITSLMTTEMNAIKNVASLHKEIREMELKERKLLHELTGKNVKMSGNTDFDRLLTIADTVNVGFRGQPGVGDITPVNPLDKLPSYGGGELNKVKAEVTPEINKSDAVDVTPKNIVPEPKVENKTITPIEGRVQVLEEDEDLFKGLTQAGNGTANLFSAINNEEKNKYVSSTNPYEQGPNADISTSQAEVAIYNKHLSQTVQKCHYDPETEYAWIRTHDATTGEIVKQESLIPPELHGRITIVNGSGSTYALDEREETFEVISDSFENAPDIIKEDLIKVYGKK